jgi:two-component system, OmpR family, sensor histidine kinase CpxA
MRLFLKIFLFYWVAQALFLVIAILFTLATSPSREISNLQSRQSQYLADAVKAYQAGGAEGTRLYLRPIHDSEHVRFFLFDEHGKELLGRNPPEWIERVRQGKTHTADTIWGRLGAGQFLRTATSPGDGHTYTLVTELPTEGNQLFGPHGIPGLGIIISILCSGLVCYVLARYLTSPVVRLRAATQRLAAGDLSARTGVTSRRNDEMAELVRDFDSMAVRLEALLKAQGRLLNDISHELRSPLARLNVALGLVRQRSGPEAQSAIDRIDLEATRLNELIGRLLTIARLEAGNDGLRGQSVNLADLVEEVANDANFEAQTRNCHVIVDAAQDLIVQGNAEVLHSALENVVRNALRYTWEGTDVQVSLKAESGADGKQAVLRVGDFGPGVPESSLDKLFEPFYRIDDSRGRETGGVGLGLAITERAVRLHGGTVRASNRPEGGLIVEIRLPLAAIGAPPVADLASSKTKRSSSDEKSRV